MENKFISPFGRRKSVNAILKCLAFAALLFSSCITQEKCLERYPYKVLSDSTSIKETSSHKRDTTYLPGAIVSVTVTIPCPDLDYHKEEKKGHVTGIIDIKDGKINFTCREDSLMQINDSLTKQLNILRHIVVQAPEAKPKCTSGWHSYCQWNTIISWMVALIALVIWIRNKAKPQLP